MEFSNTEVITLLSLVTGSFVATNMDNLLILVVLLGANSRRRSAVLLGFICSCIAVICVAALGVAVGSMLGAGLIGYLGVIPLALGCHMLYKSWAGHHGEDEALNAPSNSTEPKIWLSTFVLMLSNSGDSIAVFLPLLAESGRAAILVIVCSYLAMAVLWAGLSYMISGQRELARRIEHRAEKIVPWIMIGVGIYILMDTATDTLV
ncbi:MAG: cadmium resistance transporter [Proteobacteria bacterium]|nr:cadmium resistance transporter [Pseudomonadota bacterium]